MSRENIAEALKDKRKSLGLSVDTVSVELQKYGIDVSPKSLYSYESGHRQPDADTLMALCEIYKIDDIMKTFGYTKKSPESVHPTDPEEIKEDITNKLTLLLNQLGLIGSDGEVSQEDEEFLMHIMSITKAYFKNRGKSV